VRVLRWLQVLLACFIVPAWLVVIRELLQQQQLGPAAVLAVAGLAVLLVSDAVNRQAAAAQAATAAATVTAGTMRRCLPSGRPCCCCRYELCDAFTLVQGHAVITSAVAAMTIVGHVKQQHPVS
jgi:hypothetical protein